MHQALLDHLWVWPDRYLDELVVFLWDEYNVLLSASTVSRDLKKAGWTKKKARREAKQRNADLRDYYQYEISSYQPEQLVFVDESGCDKHNGFRRTGWSPRGISPVQIAQFNRGQRYQILPAYTQDGVVFSEIFQGSTDTTVFEEFIEQLVLTVCGPWPREKSVLVMDNASFHRSKRIDQICSDAGVKLVYLPPYSPDLNPIEEFFAQFKAFVKRYWASYAENSNQDFPAFLQWCLDEAGADRKSARGHFRHAGLAADDL
jgi:transposase